MRKQRRDGSSVLPPSHQVMHRLSSSSVKLMSGQKNRRDILNKRDPRSTSAFKALHLSSCGISAVSSPFASYSGSVSDAFVCIHPPKHGSCPPTPLATNRPRTLMRPAAPTCTRCFSRSHDTSHALLSSRFHLLKPARVCQEVQLVCSYQSVVRLRSLPRSLTAKTQRPSPPRTTILL